MGIRFRCHACNEPLHVKFFQAGKRGRCPQCQMRFRVPNEDSEFSIPLESSNRELGKVVVSVSEQESPQVELQATAVATLEPSPVEPAPVQPESKETPQSLLAHGDARWFVRPPSGGVYGPADTSTLNSWISQRRVTADSYLWRDGMEVWRIAVEMIPDAFVAAPGVSPDSIAPPPVSLPDALPPVTESEKDKETQLPNPAIAKAKANLDQRRKKKRKQTWIILGLLATIALALIATLVVVLRSQ